MIRNRQAYMCVFLRRQLFIWKIYPVSHLVGHYEHIWNGLKNTRNQRNNLWIRQNVGTLGKRRDDHLNQ